MWLRSVRALLCGMIGVQLGVSLLVIALLFVLGCYLLASLFLCMMLSGCAYHVLSALFFHLLMIARGKNVCQCRRVVHTGNTGEGGAFMMIRTGTCMFKFKS